LDYDEIVKNTRSETPSAVTFDMRKFSAQQIDAIEIYLQNTGMGVQMGVLKHTKPIIIKCDPNSEISPRAQQLLASLQAKGIDIEIQQAD
jgi:hypothetical protein